jgi:hypothetical protein
MRRSIESIAVAIALGLLLAGRAHATFHLMSVSEVGAGFHGDADVQFVELRLDAGGQTNLVDTRLTVFDAAGNATELLLSDHPVADGSSGANVLYATAAFAAATGVVPDFVIPPGLVTPTGMVCWGAPGVVPPAPSAWDFDKPSEYVDCVAYGSYAGVTRPASGTPTSLAPGDGTQSLTRTTGTSTSGSNANDFALAVPTACNNAGHCTDLSRGGSEDTCGDADGNGSVTVTDGVQTLRAAAGLSSTCTLTRCDVNGSGSITVSDGVQVLRAAAGLAVGGTCTPDN